MAHKSAGSQTMGGRRAFGQREKSVCVWSLPVFARGPTGLALNKVFRLLLKGYTGDHWSNGGRKEAG